ncbi:hypothetical protein [Medusavirus stheno T3]|uniref:Uncharacterized protein n=1 Tax=Medusavirus stheno T3 TaxID=3069717 RepID=A0A7S7YEG5_9VIRU|nr:hypothetical protein QKU73_gp115 [Acanthamoeba castellanii medusavirus]QPB44296.1 hypothetical protein [Medusavirus stheno T3]
MGYIAMSSVMMVYSSSRESNGHHWTIIETPSGIIHAGPAATEDALEADIAACADCLGYDAVELTIVKILNTQRRKVRKQ